MLRRIRVWAVLTVCVLATSLASAAEDVLRLVPDSAAGLVVINRPAALDAKIQSAGPADADSCTQPVDDGQAAAWY